VKVERALSFNLFSRNYFLFPLFPVCNFFFRVIFSPLYFFHALAAFSSGNHLTLSGDPPKANTLRVPFFGSPIA
jgi:hypothetical protein